jgi:heme exporter protein CcmD
MELIRFINMGGYARYVWPAYGFALVILLFSVYMPSREHKKILRKLRKEI